MDNPAPGATSPLGGPPVKFSHSAAARTAASVLDFEGRYRGRAMVGSQDRRTDLSGTVARVTTTITARSGSTYGSGLATLQVDSGSGLTDSTDTADVGVTVKSLMDKTIVSGSTSYVVVVWALGDWWIPGPSSCSIIV